MTPEHPFAKYVRIVGKGRLGAKSLTQDEAYSAMQMMLAGEALPVQVGALLMLMRIREETAEETAGFVLAARQSLTGTTQVVDLDWASYAGKRRQLPWFLLSALLLAANGVRVFLHHIGSRDDGRVYAESALHALAICPCESLAAAEAEIARCGFAAMSLASLSPKLHELLTLRDVLGLRSPVNTVARFLNPFDASVSLHGIFHPGYREIHQRAARLLTPAHISLFKGEGGEAERNPDAPCLETTIRDGHVTHEEWPPLFATRHLRDDIMDVSRLGAFWRREFEDDYAEASVAGTAAVALRALGRADSMVAAEALAASLWRERPAHWVSTS